MAFSKMEISPSSLLDSSFSDQSHLQFYNPNRFLSSKLCLSFPSLRPPLLSFRLRPPLGALCNSACLIEHQSTQQVLMKELAELKLQIKQKKKEFKAQMKKTDMMIIGVKELKKKTKKKKKKERQVTKSQEKNMIKECASESSSSSDSKSSDCERESVSMKMIKQGHIARGEDKTGYAESLAEPASMRGESCAGKALATCIELCASESMEISEGHPSRVCSFDDSNAHGSRRRELYSRVQSRVDDVGSHVKVMEDTPSSGLRSNVDDAGLHTSSLLCRGVKARASVNTSSRIEVCAGGKCKKAGSEPLLLALRAQIPSSSGVEAVPCKCMGKCGMAVNVRVHKEDTNPQHHSHVSVTDAELILRHHFGLGRPASGLPCPHIHTEVRSMPSPHLTA